MTRLGRGRLVEPITQEADLGALRPGLRAQVEDHRFHAGDRFHHVLEAFVEGAARQGDGFQRLKGFDESLVGMLKAFVRFREALLGAADSVVHLTEALVELAHLVRHIPEKYIPGRLTAVLVEG